ncbi:MAG: PEP-CTERM sorting domain-containing protein [Nitrospira sp.]|nr:PEP-CTERM sorting domain-containing protein [Nitrospira sp.]HBP87941.1 hypothetical protein [Nitrospiraceae bacterium]
MTFTTSANLGSVPEPSNSSLIGTGLSGLLTLRLKP